MGLWHDFFIDDDGRGSMGRLGFFIGLVSATVFCSALILMGKFSEGYFTAYLGFPTLGYFGGKGWDAWQAKVATPAINLNQNAPGATATVGPNTPAAAPAADPSTTGGQ